MGTTEPKLGWQNARFQASSFANLYPNQYILVNEIRALPRQLAKSPDDFKPMPGIGKGVEEIRVWDESGTYRVVYTARLSDVVIVLHAFQNKSQTISKRDIALAKERFTDFMKGQK